MEIENEIKEIKDKLSNLENYLIDLNGKITHLINYKNSDKLELLKNYVLECKQVDTPGVMRLLKMSRPWALKLMRELEEKHKFFKFFDGNKALGRPARICFIQEKKFNEDVARAGAFISETNDPVIIGKIAEFLKLEIGVQWDYLMLIIKCLTSEHSDEFERVDNIKVRYTGEVYKFGDGVVNTK